MEAPEGGGPQSRSFSLFRPLDQLWSDQRLHQAEEQDPYPEPSHRHLALSIGIGLMGWAGARMR